MISSNNTFPQINYLYKNLLQSDEEKQFKDSFSHLFTDYIFLPSNKIKRIHDERIALNLNFQKMTTDEFNRINLYFHNYISYKDQILQYLIENRNEIMANIVYN